MDETWLYHYDPETKQQSSGGVAAHPAPKNFKSSNSLEISRFDFFFWIKTASSPLIIFPGAKLSTRSITHLCWCNWRTFWRKTAGRGRSRRGSCSCTIVPRLTGSPGTCNPEKKLPYLGFQCLDHPPYSPDPVPSDYRLFPGLKKQLKDRHFSSDAEVIAAAETWLYGQPSDFFRVACKS